MSCVKEEMGCLTGWVAGHVPDKHGRGDREEGGQSLRLSGLMDSNDNHKFSMLARQSVFSVKLL
jgi:hypothetical protein